MKTKLFAVACALGAASLVYAGSTGTTQLQTPQGSGSSTPFGDIVSDANALNTSYHFFIEVPPGQSRLDVDVFDPDIGLGNAANEDLAGRDRDRGTFNTAATYSLFNPSGAARTTNFTTGNATTPAASDNAWVNFFSSTGDTVRDNFGTAAYTNNDGLQSWATNWTETSDDNNAGNGDIRITGGELRVGDNGAAPFATIQREANLTGWTSATFSFDFRMTGVDATDQMRVEVSNNGGGSWTTLETFTGPLAASSRSYDITTSIASNTRIRFISNGGYGNNDFFFVDNLQIKDSVITAGHWEVRIDMSSAVTAGDSINAYGLRAHDGTSGAGGTEYNIYADSNIAMGANPPNTGTNTRSYNFYPYITSGCTCGHNDYDFDSNSGNVGSMVYTSRLGTFTQTLASASLSANDVWNRDTITGYTSDILSSDYGIWSLAGTINSYLVAGNPNGNYGTVYISNYAAAANPPAANPTANSHRIYLPADAGVTTAPVKPYLEQLLTQRFNGTLAVGTSGRYTVTVRMNNPTAWPVVFSATRLVTSNVPGSGAVYGGNAQVSQGSVASQPAVGGTGNITWNPGTLAAGGTAILSYDVTVTPTSAGQRIPITATPASGNGTRATWLDETANASQARAIFTFGPICELAATQGLLTEVVVSSFNVDTRGGAASIEWTTASEVGTIGFNLYRVDAATGTQTRVNRATIPADPRAPHGGRYRFVDSGSSDPNATYVLEELTANGRANRYGPYAANSQQHLPQQKPARPAVASKRLRPEPDTSFQGPAQNSVALMVGVRQSGIVRIPATAIAGSFLVPPLPIANGIRNGNLSITSDGAPVAWTLSPDGNAVLFYGEAPNTQYSNDRVYRIEMKRGTQMDVVDVAPAAGSTTTFTSSRDLEVDAFAATVLPLDPESDYWFWDYVIPGDAADGQKTFTVDVPSVASSNNVALQVRLQGAASVAHKAQVSLNGTPVGEVTWNALGATSTELNVPAALLHSGANAIRIDGVLEPGVGFDVFYVDGFTLRYPRAAQPENGRLEMTATPGATIAAGPFAAGALAFDITDKLHPRLLRGAMPSNGNVSFVAPAAAQKLFLTDANAFVNPSFIRGAVASSLDNRNNAADYVVIAPAALRSAADGLAQLRQREGLLTTVVDLQRVYDEFAGGNSTPHAIRAFVAATQTWQRKPRYIVLAGIGTLDYRGIAVPPGLLPPLMAKTADGLFASDSRFTDFDNDGLPDVAIGRIPVTTAAELDAYVRKLDQAAHADNPRSLLFVADAQDGGADFRSHSAIVEAPVSGRPSTRLYVDDLGATAVRNSLLQAWQAGAPLVNWIGHGGIDQLSSSALLTAADVPSLTSTNRLPLFLAMTCTINRFELGDVDALGTQLTRTPNAGALAVWSASGLSVNAEATQLERTFMQLAAKTPDARIGDLIVQSFAANRGIGETGSVYLLLGDPAVRLTMPKEPTSGGTPPSGRE
jgi:hypothetical protein